MWILIILFVHHGLLRDQQSLWTYPYRLETQQSCVSQSKYYQVSNPTFYTSICVNAGSK